jgi:hypothetical protein
MTILQGDRDAIVWNFKKINDRLALWLAARSIPPRKKELRIVVAQSAREVNLFPKECRPRFDTFESQRRPLIFGFLPECLVDIYD